MTVTGPLHPAMRDLEAPEQIARWRPLVQWLLAIPHLLIAGVLSYVVQVVYLINFFAVLFTRCVPEGLHNFNVMYERYAWRAYSYAAFMHDKYPPFDFTMAAAEPGGSPATTSLERAAQLNRWLPLVKWLLAIPHYIVLIVLFLVAFVLIIVAFFAVLITGKFPLGIRNFLVGVSRWGWRVNAYVWFLRDEYPPFSFDA